MDETDRLMLAMASRARARRGTCGHAIARWEALRSRRAAPALGIGAMELARICVTPLPRHMGQVAALCLDTGCDPLLLAEMIGATT